MKISEIKPASYNPRTISKEKLKMLAKSMNEFGDLSGFVFNIKTGNLVGGHQRLKCVPQDAVVEKTLVRNKSNVGTIAEGYIILNGEKFSYREVSWDILKEKSANIAANKHGGDFDMDKLSEMLCELQDAEIGLDLLGFSSGGIEDLLPNNALEEYQKAADMPEYNYEPRGYRTLMVHFRTEDAVKCFTKELNVKITEKTKYIWYPIENAT